MGGDRRRTLMWVAVGLVVAGVAVGAFSVGRAAAGPTNATPTDVSVRDDTAIEMSGDTPAEATAADAPAQKEATEQPVASSVVVYISGAVAQPDTYTLPADARVKDVVLAAGGFSADAATDSINLAQRIADGQHIHIPRVGEAAAAPVENVSAPSASAAGRININQASTAQLEGLPRIGAALAQRIVEWRGANGPFRAVDDVQKVKGVSASVFEEIKDLISID